MKKYKLRERIIPVREKNNSKYKRERVKAETLAKELTPDPSKLISPDGEIVLTDPKDASLRDVYAEKCDLLKTEWAFYGGELEPEMWLEMSKGYDRRMAKKIVSFEGYEAWREKRLSFQNMALERFTMRSVDTLVEFQDYVSKGAKLTLVRAMEMLQTPVRKIDPTTKKWMTGLTSMDLKNCAETIDKSQTIIMRALGVHPKEEIGIKVIYEQLKTIQVNQAKDGKAGSTIDEETGELIPSPTEDPRMETMTHEDVWAMVEALRELRKKEGSNEG
jgi:hypothetical protein